MGNTKLIYIEGEFKRDMSPTEAQLMDWSHGSYCTAKVVPGGYLGQGKDGAEYFIASLHTSSMQGVRVVDYLAEYIAHLLWARVVVADLDWSDVTIHHIINHVDGDAEDHVVAKYEYQLPPRKEPPPPPGQPPPDFQQCAANPRCAGELVCEHPPIGWRFWCREHSPHGAAAAAFEGAPGVSSRLSCNCKPENVINANAARAAIKP